MAPRLNKNFAVESLTFVIILTWIDRVFTFALKVTEW